MTIKSGFLRNMYQTTLGHVVDDSDLHSDEQGPDFDDLKISEK
jgi:hypothetical protein